MISGLSTWNIDIQDNCQETIDHFLNFSKIINVNFMLNLKNEHYCFIEKLIYDTIYFHSKRLNIELTNKSVTFWSKIKSYDFDYIHMHKDHCDYESRVFNTERKKPIFTTLIYLNDNNCPTLITEISSTTELNTYKTLNSNLGISFPRKNKNICFDSGNYYHGESYLTHDDNTDRKVIVIALWDNINTPHHIPYFSSDLFYYYMFNNHGRLINEIEKYKFTKNNSIVKFINNDNNIIHIRYYNIESNFFEKLLIIKEKHILFKFFELLYKFMILDTFIIKLNYQYK